MIFRMQISVLLIFLITVQGIYLPIRNNYSRCLIEFMVAQAHTGTVKLRIVFPQIQNMERGEHFTVTMRDTETNKVQSSIVKPGTTFLKEMDLVDNVIYEVCMQVKTERAYEAILEYTSEKLFFYDHQAIKVPENLLKKNDMKQAFEFADKMAQTITDFSEHQATRKAEEKGQFFETEKLHDKLTLLSGFECLIVVAVGLYQFFTLKNYLQNRQYI